MSHPWKETSGLQREGKESRESQPRGQEPWPHPLLKGHQRKPVPETAPGRWRTGKSGPRPAGAWGPRGQPRVRTCCGACPPSRGEHTHQRTQDRGQGQLHRSSNESRCAEDTAGCPKRFSYSPPSQLAVTPVLAENDDTARDDERQGDSKQAVVAGSSGAGRQRRQVPTAGGCLHKDQAMQDPRQPERPAQCLWDRTQPARVQPARSSDQREHSLRCSIVSCATKGRPTERPSHSCQTATRKVASHPSCASGARLRQDARPLWSLRSCLWSAPGVSPPTHSAGAAAGPEVGRSALHHGGSATHSRSWRNRQIHSNECFGDKTSFRKVTKTTVKCARAGVAPGPLPWLTVALPSPTFL